MLSVIVDAEAAPVNGI